MGLLGDFAKGFLILTLVLWGFAIIGLLVIGQILFAMLLFLVLMIPFSTVIYEYLKNRRKVNERRRP